MIDGRQPGDRINLSDDSDEFVSLAKEDVNNAVVIQVSAKLQAPSPARRTVNYAAHVSQKRWTLQNNGPSAFAAMVPAPAAPVSS